MKAIVSLDYEMFLGTETGSVNKCLIEPLGRLLKISDKYNFKYTIFVDATYLFKLKEEKSKNEILKQDYENICKNIQFLNNQGHCLQLHIHPHWYYSVFDGAKWIQDTEHYKLSDIDIESANYIFNQSKLLLEKIIDEKIIAYRAGGFSTQPTSILKTLLFNNEIKIDSSVYRGSIYHSKQQDYDYSNAPNKGCYYFDEDICCENKDGQFLEVPLFTFEVSPYFYWKLALTKILNNKKHQILGDGNSIETTKESIKERLTKKSNMFATIDGYKSSILNNAYTIAKKKNISVFNVIGHPKLQTPYSLDKFEKFCASLKDIEFITITELLK
ncbi:MAG: hypothetical protein LBL74_01360 [Bacteroidales bacterium]|jgi:hypothetical protein|nr:hypothetical protein [Bacteroidales bacterium]